MGVAGKAVAGPAGIENGDVAAGTTELQGGGETGKAAADDDDVIHGDGLRAMGEGKLVLRLACTFKILWSTLIQDLEYCQVLEFL
jgi:hypothetical protein